MIPLDFCKNKHVGVVGFGKTGKSAADALIASGANVYVYEDNCGNNNIVEEHQNLLFTNDLELVAKLDFLVVSPGINTLWPKVHPIIKKAKENFIPILNDVDLFQRSQMCDQLRNQVATNNHQTAKNICITGTNGKSTTTALIYHLLNSARKNVSIGGNFGNPILSLDPNSDVFVFELSSYQLESCNILGFDTSVLLNITPDHLTRHGGMEGYIASKEKIFANFHEKSIAIVGVDDDYCLKIFEFLKKIKHKCVIPISGKTVPEFGIGWDANKLIDNRQKSYEFVCENNSIVGGDGNLQNIAAAYAACISSVHGLSKKEFCEGLSSFRGLEHRQEFVARIDGVEYINDSKATNADSVEQALIRFNNIIWILGGRPKEDGIESLIKYFHKIKYALLIGEAAKDWSSLLAHYGVKNEISETLDTAVRRSVEISKIYSADIVLLSPACASFDQFKDFEDRGNQFKRLVNDLVGSLINGSINNREKSI